MSFNFSFCYELPIPESKKYMKKKTMKWHSFHINTINIMTTHAFVCDEDPVALKYSKKLFIKIKIKSYYTRNQNIYIAVYHSQKTQSKVNMFSKEKKKFMDSNEKYRHISEIEIDVKIWLVIYVSCVTFYSRLGKTFSHFVTF